MSKYWFLLCLLISASGLAANDVQLATVYEDEHVEQYLVSEKLDGIRAIWDGKHLVTRKGVRIYTPKGYTSNWPNVWLDGELWAGEGSFNLVQHTVLDQSPSAPDWKKIVYMVFDAPAKDQTFEQRANSYHTLLLKTDSKTIRPIAQHSLDGEEALYRMLDEVVAKGGEGLMLHRKDALHKSGRSNALLKLKPYQDAEARVVEHLPGNGKYAGMLGSILVESADGVRFKIGTGFSDTERKHPPEIGQYVTFRYQGLTVNGIPRFASFLRIREGEFDFRPIDP